MILKLYWDESIDFCEQCVVKKACDRGELNLDCGDVGIYQIKDIPEEPKPEYETEYEWKSKRYELLKSLPYASSEIMNEIGNLSLWLEESKPKPKEKWETCTKENTLVGDKVKYIHHGGLRKVKYIHNTEDLFVVSDTSGNGSKDGKAFVYMDNYLINTAKEK